MVFSHKKFCSNLLFSKNKPYSYNLSPFHPCTQSFLFIADSRKLTRWNGSSHIFHRPSQTIILPRKLPLSLGLRYLSRESVAKKNPGRGALILWVFLIRNNQQNWRKGKRSKKRTPLSTCVFQFLSTSMLTL